MEAAAAGARSPEASSSGGLRWWRPTSPIRPSAYMDALWALGEAPVQRVGLGPLAQPGGAAQGCVGLCWPGYLGGPSQLSRSTVRSIRA